MSDDCRRISWLRCDGCRLELLTRRLIDNDQRVATTPSPIHDGQAVGSVVPGADEELITAEEELRPRPQQVAQRGPSDTPRCRRSHHVTGLSFRAHVGGELVTKRWVGWNQRASMSLLPSVGRHV